MKFERIHPHGDLSETSLDNDYQRFGAQQQKS